VAVTLPWHSTQLASNRKTAELKPVQRVTCGLTKTYAEDIECYKATILVAIQAIFTKNLKNELQAPGYDFGPYEAAELGKNTRFAQGSKYFCRGFTSRHNYKL